MNISTKDFNNADTTKKVNGITQVQCALNTLIYLQGEDAKYLQSLGDNPATFCVSCRKNKPIRLTPFWHRFPRRLCNECRGGYIDLIKNLGAEDLSE